LKKKKQIYEMILNNMSNEAITVISLNGANSREDLLNDAWKYIRESVNGVYDE